MTRIDKRKLSIAVIGRSMTGKTSWITSLFRDDINVEFREICLKNKEGQTKLKTSYELADTEEKRGIFCKEISFTVENLEKLKGKDPSGILKKLEGMGLIDESDIPMVKEQQLWTVSLVEKDIDIKSLFESVINNKDMVESDVIQDILISVPTSPDVWGIISELNLEQVVIHDTRGMMDETESFEDKFREIDQIGVENDGTGHGRTNDRSGEKEGRLIKRLLSERGVLNADVCIFMTDGGMDMLVKQNRNRYGFIFKHVADSMPIFIATRSSLLSDVMEEDETSDINTYCRLMAVDANRSFSGRLSHEKGFEPIVELIAGFKEKNPELDDTAIDVNKDNISLLLLPYIDTKDKDEYQQYLYAAHGAFKLLLEGAYKFKAEQAEFVEQNEKLPQMLKEAFREAFKSDFKKYIYEPWYYKRLRYCGNTDVYERIIKGNYYGGVDTGLLGPKGGMTSWVAGYGRIGKYAISILEAAHDVFYDISESLCKNDKIFTDEEMRKKLRSYLSRMLDSYSFSYSCTYMMLREEALRNARKQTLEAIENGTIGSECSFISEYAGSFAVVYFIMDRLIQSVIEHSEKNGIEFNPGV